MLRFVLRRIAGSAEEALETQGNLAQQAQHEIDPAPPSNPPKRSIF
jgi:hypothetical protein